MTKWLSTSGIIAATVLAITIIFCLGYEFLTYPIIFLIFGSLLSKINKGVLEHDDSNGRNARQVLSNGGVGLILCVIYNYTQDQRLIGAFIVTFSCATSDTFSSEIGRYFKCKTIDILTLKEIRPGLSGGISAIGTFGGFVGSFIIAYPAYLLDHVTFKVMIIVIVLGFLGMIIDSIIGSGLQAKFFIKGQLLENGKRPQLVKGLYWMDNNLVNFLSIIMTSLIFLLFL